MDGLAFLCLGLALVTHPLKLPEDVFVIDTRTFAMFVRWHPDDKARSKRIRLFVSEDEGKTWKHVEDYESSADRIVFTASRDGLYWFAVPAVGKEGELEPRNLGSLTLVKKVYVNTQRKPVKVQKSRAVLQREAELQKIIQQQLGIFKNE